MKIQHITDQISIFRDDLNHPELIGNKMRKLKYNLLHAKENGHDTLVTFGGAFSNHLLATSAAGRIHGIKSVGIVRGEELAHKPLNHVLQQCQANGMELHFIDRAQYQRKDIRDLEADIGRHYLIPEGGTNALALKGVGEILDEISHSYDAICVPCGTGGTLAGLVAGAHERNLNCEIIGFPVLRGGDFIAKELKSLLPHPVLGGTSWRLVTDYHFGGYAKQTDELSSFILNFQKQHNIPLDPIYSGKMMFGVMHENWSDKKILAIHTGGWQTT